MEELMNFVDIQSKVIEEAARSIALNKSQLIIDAGKRIGLDLENEFENTVRFPKLCRVTEGNNEYIFYNDGSKNGKMLIRFENITKTELVDGVYSVKTAYKIYT